MLTHNRGRWLRVAAIRVVAGFFAVFAALLTLALLAIPISAIWPDGPLKFRRGQVSTWWLVAVLVLFGFATARTSWLLWRRQRAGAIFASLVFASAIATNYYGPLKGTQAVGVSVAMLALLLVGWGELE